MGVVQQVDTSDEASDGSIEARMGLAAGGLKHAGAQPRVGRTADVLVHRCARAGA
jgi:hypothetical protein